MSTLSTHADRRHANRLSPGQLARGARIVLGRELGAYFDSGIAYVYTIAAIVLANSLFMNEFFLGAKLDMTPYFDALPTLAVFLLPAISMRLWAEDKKTRLFELWMTLPLSPLQVILGKFTAALALYLVFLAGSLPIVVMLAWLGAPDPGLLAAGYLGAILLGGLFLAFGMLLSALSSDQITAFISSALLAFLLVFTGHERVVAVLDGLAPTWGVGTLLRDSISIQPHYEPFVRGLVPATGLIYFLGLGAVFLWLNAFVVREDRR